MERDLTRIVAPERQILGIRADTATQLFILSVIKCLADHDLGLSRQTPEQGLPTRKQHRWHVAFNLLRQAFCPSEPIATQGKSHTRGQECCITLFLKG